MENLKIGDQVLTGDGHYAEVYSFGHKEPSTDAHFLQIRSSETSDPIEITQEHMLYVRDVVSQQTKIIAAGSVNVGDTLVTPEGTSKVTSIRTVKLKGVYSPLTTTGSIVVDGIVASNYVSRAWLPEFIEGKTLHWLQHGAALPYRLYCKAKGGCQDETYDEANGFSPWVNFWFGWEAWQMEAHPIIRAFFLAALFVPAVLAITTGMIMDMAGCDLARQIALFLVGALLVFKKNQVTAEGEDLKKTA